MRKYLEYIGIGVLILLALRLLLNMDIFVYIAAIVVIIELAYLVLHWKENKGKVLWIVVGTAVLTLLALWKLVA